MHPTRLTRRHFVLGAGALSLAGCAATPRQLAAPVAPAAPNPYLTTYAPLLDEEFPIPAPDLSKIDPRFYRQYVDYQSPEPAGTLIVDTNQFFLYLTRPGGKALRYGVGLGRAGFGWSGRADILMKRKWPTWTPPEEMIERQPELEKFSYRNGGQPPGLDNALGARALYLFENGKDTLYRLHGTNQETSIGRAVSSGCVRLLNHDIVDLYDRVPRGTQVVVIASSAPPAIS